jgi:DNA-binding MarR family transcriptional regulator
MEACILSGKVVVKMAEGPYIGKWVSMLYRAGQVYLDRRTEGSGIAGAYIPFLLCLYRQDGVTQDAISTYLNVDKATTARAIAALEGLGHVFRERDLADKRAYKVFLTESGRLLEPNLRAELQNWSGIVTENFTDKEQEVAYQLLQRMATNAVAAKAANWGIKLQGKKGMK